MSSVDSVRPELEIQSRYVLLAPLADGRRVLDLGGDARSLLTLAEAGAAELTAVSAAPAELGAALDEAGVEGVEVLAADGPPLDAEEDAFDLVICHDLGERIAGDRAWITELRRVLAPDGYLVLALANAGGHALSEIIGQRFDSAMSYDEAFAALSSSFGQLTLFGQSPVVANLFFDFESEEEEPGLVFDRSLLLDESEEAGWYLLVFGPETLHRDDLVIVQAPLESLTAAHPAVVARDAAQGGRDDPHAYAVISAQEAELRVMRLRALAAEDALAVARAQAGQAPPSAEAEHTLAEAGSRAQELEREVEEARRVVARLEGEMDQVQRVAAELEERAKNAELHLREAEAEAQLRVLEAEQAAGRTARDLGQDADERRRQLEQRSQELAEAQSRIAELEAQAQARVAELEAQAQQRVAELEAQAQQRAAELEAQAQQRAADLGGQLEQRGQELAQAQARVAELEAQAQQGTEELERRAREAEAAAAEAGRKVEELEQEGADNLTEVQAKLEAVQASLEEERDALATSRERVGQLEQELELQTRDRQSFESQIKDLFDEIAQLRQAGETSQDGLAAAKAAEQTLASERDEAVRALQEILYERDSLVQQAEQEKARADALFQESARLGARVAEMEAELARPATHPEPSASEASPSTPEGVSAPVYPEPSRDAVGRPIEASLEEIEDLISTSVPSSPKRR